MRARVNNENPRALYKIVRFSPREALSPLSRSGLYENVGRVGRIRQELG